MTTRIIMRNDGRATAEGETEIFGTSGAQTVTILDGATVTFRSGFNTGGDTIRINGRASDFTASISGSNVTLRSNVDNITVVIPIGTTANTIVFDNGDSRSLSLVGGVPTLGGQTITAAGVPVTAGPGTFTISGDASANEGDTITYTVTRTDTTSAETLFFSVDGSTNGGVVAAATQGADFNPASGVVTFAAGAATATFTVAVSTDAVVEGLEGISVRVIKGSEVVASTNATIIDGQSQGQGTPLTAGVDNVVGTGGNDTITGRLSEFSSLDTVTGGAGIDTLVLTGVLPGDVQPQPAAVLDAAFERTSGIENLTLTGGTLAQSVDAVLGPLAAAAGLQQVIAGGTGGQAQVIDIQAFNAALTVTGSGNAETVNVNLGTAGAKTLNLGAGADTVNVTPVSTLAGSVQVNFASGAVANGTNDTVTIVSANGNVTVNDESTSIISDDLTNNIFNVVGLAADGTVDPAQDRGNFARVELGTAAADVVTTGATIPATNTGFPFFLPVPAVPNPGNVYFNLGAGNDTVTAIAEAGERHFVVGGIGNDTLTATTEAGNSRVVALMGEGNDTVVVNQNAGLVDINLGDGDDTIRFTAAFTPNLAGAAALRDVVSGGAGRDTILATSAALTAIDNTVVGAVQSVSGIEALTVTNLLSGNLTTGLVQAGIDTVTLAAGTNGGSTVTFDSGLASTLNLAAPAGGTIRVASAGTGTADQVTINNTAGGNAFGGNAIVTGGVETLIVNTSATGLATTQTIGGISGTPAGRVNFVGGNSVNAGTIDARTVDASGLTGTAGITATTTNADNAANSFTGSGGNDTVTLGAGRQNLNLGGGNDTVVINAINALGTGTSSLNGGDGIDTLRMNTNDAATLSITNIFNANNSGFEVLSLNRQAQGPANGPGVVETIRIDNIGTDVNKVISAGTADGTPGTGTAEVVSFSVRDLASGQSITISQPQLVGPPITVTYTNTSGASESSITVANGLAALLNGLAPAAGSLDAQFDAVAVGGGGTGPATVTLTGTTFADLGNVAVTYGNAAVANVTFNTATGGNQQGVDPIAAGAEVTTFVLDTSIGDAATFDASIGDGTVTFTDGTVSFVFASPIDLSGQTPELALAIQEDAQANAAWNAVYETTVVGNNVVFTARPAFAGPRGDINTTGDIELANENIQRVQGTPAVPGQNEVTTITWSPLLQGQSITVAGRTVTATTQDLTAIDVANAFEFGLGNVIVTFPANGASVTGVVTDWTVSNNPGNAITTFTSSVAANVTDLSGSLVLAPATLPMNPTVTTVDGVLPGVIGPAGTLIIQNLDSNGTLEITDDSAGLHEVRVTDSGLNTNDVLNLELTNNEGSFNNFGTVKADNVERVNIITKDTGTGANAAATTEFVTLDILQATTLTVSGNNGLVIAHNSSAITTFDASGVVGNAGDSRQALGVTFQSLNNSTTASVTITGGIGNDDFIGGRANDTFNLATGGSDLVQFAATRTLNGLDTINGFTGGSGAGGDVLDLAGAGAVTLIDGNGAATGVIFNATPSNTGDLILTGNNSNVYLVTDGNASIDLTNIKDTSGDTAQTGEILLTDNTSAYVLHATSAGSNTFTVLRVFDSNAAGGIVQVSTEVLGTVNLTNTFGNLNANNFDQTFVPAQDPLTAADVAAAMAPVAMVGMLENVGSFAIA